MKKITKRIISIACVCIMVCFVGSFGVNANTGNSLESYQLKALGRLECDVDKSGNAGDHPSDVVYDADDLYRMESLVKTGKTKLASSINAYTTGNVKSLDTFSNLSAAVDTLTDFPSGKYYYDSTTGTDDATTLVRYIKENGSYYLCDQYGNKTSNTAQTVNENNLVEYKETDQENLTAGTAGMVGKTFVLGNGSDNITYWNQGAANSKVGNATAAEVLIGKTFTNSSGVGLTGSMPNKGAWTNTPTGSGKVTIPEGYHNGSGYVDTATVYTNAYNAGVAAADGRINTSSSSYTAGYNAAKSNINPVLYSQTGTSWNDTATLQTVVPAGYYYLVKASCLRTDFGTNDYELTVTPSHELEKVHYASVDTTVTYSVYTDATRASFTLAVIYWK